MDKKVFAIGTHALNNEDPTTHTNSIEDSDSKHQLVPQNVHRKNTAVREIATFKDHSLRILAGVNKIFYMSMWDNHIE